MPRLLASHLFIISLLFMGIEGAMDSVADEHAHGGDVVHLADSNSSSLIDMEDQNDHCQHCFHGHASCISGHITAINFGTTDQRFSFYNVNITNLAQAPPTPPPNV